MNEQDELLIYEYQIQSYEKLSGNVFRFLIEPIHTPLHYHAGQYVKIRYPNGLFLPFSLANAPNSEGILELHIRNYEHDLDTHVFIDELINEHKIYFMGPYGQSYYRPGIALPILLLAAGTGFAPSKAILEAIFEQPDAKQVHLYWGVRHLEDFYLPDLPSMWQKQHPNFLFTPVLSKSSTEKWPGGSKVQGKQGYVTHCVVADYPNLADFQVYLFGSMQMAITAEKLFTEHGLPREYLFSDMLCHK